MKIQFKKLKSEAKLPTYAHVGDAGMDLYAVESQIIKAGERALVPTGVACAIPDGYVGLVWDKSGVSLKGGLKTIAGVVDAPYRGELLVAVYNLSDSDYQVEAGQKIAQMLIQPVIQVDIIEVENLDDTTRGDGGFGSTGLY